jgi:rhodanese-related sulfurtransferase
MLPGLVLVLTLGCGGAPPASPPATRGTTEALPAAPTVSGPEARRLVAEGAFLLNVTRADRAPEAHIDGAVSIPLPELSDRLAEVPRDRPVVVYCLGGRGSPRAGALLQAEGYDVHVLGARPNWDATE